MHHLPKQVWQIREVVLDDGHQRLCTVWNVFNGCQIPTPGPCDLPQQLMSQCIGEISEARHVKPYDASMLPNHSSSTSMGPRCHDSGGGQFVLCNRRCKFELIVSVSEKQFTHNRNGRGQAFQKVTGSIHRMTGLCPQSMTVPDRISFFLKKYPASRVHTPRSTSPVLCIWCSIHRSDVSHHGIRCVGGFGNAFLQRHQCTVAVHRCGPHRLPWIVVRLLQQNICNEWQRCRIDLLEQTLNADHESLCFFPYERCRFGGGSSN